MSIAEKHDNQPQVSIRISFDVIERKKERNEENLLLSVQHEEKPFIPHKDVFTHRLKKKMMKDEG